MKLQLQRPIVFFDLETTGIKISEAHIVEICYIKLWPNGDEEAKTMRVRPANVLGETLHIPEESTAIHGISDDDVKDCKTFRELAEDIYKVFQGCDIAGYNSNNYDVPLLVEEFYRAGLKQIDFSDTKFVDVCVIYKKMNSRTLSAAYKQYCHKDLEDAHSALADTRATLDVLEAQLDAHPDILQNDIAQLSEYSTQKKIVDYDGKMTYNNAGEVVFAFGKYKDIPVKEVLRTNPGYYDWMMQGDFLLDTKVKLEKLRLQK